MMLAPSPMPWLHATAASGAAVMMNIIETDPTTLLASAATNTGWRATSRSGRAGRPAWVSPAAAGAGVAIADPQQRGRQQRQQGHHQIRAGEGYRREKVATPGGQCGPAIAAMTPPAITTEIARLLAAGSTASAAASR